MVKKKQQVNKMVKQEKHVWECIRCGYKLISDKHTKQCPACKFTDTFVIRQDFIVTKGV